MNAIQKLLPRPEAKANAHESEDQALDAATFAGALEKANTQEVRARHDKGVEQKSEAELQTRKDESGTPAPSARSGTESSARPRVTQQGPSSLGQDTAQPENAAPSNSFAPVVRPSAFGAMAQGLAPTLPVAPTPGLTLAPGRSGLMSQAPIENFDEVLAPVQGQGVLKTAGPLQMGAAETAQPLNTSASSPTPVSTANPTLPTVQAATPDAVLKVATQGATAGAATATAAAAGGTAPEAQPSNGMHSVRAAVDSATVISAEPQAAASAMKSAAPQPTPAAHAIPEVQAHPLPTPQPAQGAKPQKGGNSAATSTPRPTLGASLQAAPVETPLAPINAQKLGAEAQLGALSQDPIPQSASGTADSGPRIVPLGQAAEGQAVGSTSATSAASGKAAPTPVSDTASIMDQLALQMKPRRPMVVVHLDPKNLGKMIVRLSMHRGELNARITTSSDRTARLLEADVPLLYRTLEGNGLKVAEVQVHSDPNQEFGEQGMLDRRTKQGEESAFEAFTQEGEGQTSQDDAKPATAAPSSTTPVSVHRSGSLDLTI